MAEKKAPAIRFKGFTDDWEQRKLRDMGTTFTGLSGKSKEDFGHGEAQFVTYMNVYSNPVADLSMTEHVEKDNHQAEVRYGDVFFTTSSETPEEVGISSVWLGNADNTYLNSFCFGYRPDCETEPYYMAYMLRSDSIRKKLIFLAQGISRYNISKNKVMDIEIPLPELAEQKKIGAYFKTIDKLITLHQEKLKLTILSVHSLNTISWEQRKLGDFCEMYNGDRGINYPKDADMVSEGIPFVNAGDLQNGNVNLSSANKISREKYNQLGGAKIQRGDILYCLRGTLGKNAFVDNFNEGTVASSLVDIRPKNIDPQYLFTVLNSDIEYRQRTICDEGAAQPNLSAKNLANFDIPTPTYEEQVVIGKYFEGLSNLITLHQ